MQQKMKTPQYTDQQLQLALAKMLPEKIVIEPLSSDAESDNVPCWSGKPKIVRHGLFLHPIIEDTEWLHVCWLVEDTLRPSQQDAYTSLLVIACERDEWRRYPEVRASWQQRAVALAKVKGVEI